MQNDATEFHHPFVLTYYPNLCYLYFKQKTNASLLPLSKGTFQLDNRAFKIKHSYLSSQMCLVGIMLEKSVKIWRSLRRLSKEKKVKTENGNFNFSSRRIKFMNSYIERVSTHFIITEDCSLWYKFSGFFEGFGFTKHKWSLSDLSYNQRK